MVLEPTACIDDSRAMVEMSRDSGPHSDTVMVTYFIVVAAVTLSHVTGGTLDLVTSSHSVIGSPVFMVSIVGEYY